MAVPDVEALVDALTARLRPLEIAANQAWWLASTSVSDEHERRRVSTEINLRNALGDAASYRQVRDALAAIPDDGSLLRRQLEALYDRTLPHQVPADLRAEMVELEAQVDGTFNAFAARSTVRRSTTTPSPRCCARVTTDAQRRAAWEASKQVGTEVAERVTELARLRNRAARHLGARDHFALSLSTSELDETRLFETLDEVDRVTAAPFAQWKADLDQSLSERFGCPAGDLRPWHYDDPFFQEPPAAGSVSLDQWLASADLEALTVRTYDGLGLDVRGVLERSDLLPRAARASTRSASTSTVKAMSAC